MPAQITLALAVFQYAQVSHARSSKSSDALSEKVFSIINMPLLSCGITLKLIMLTPSP